MRRFLLERDRDESGVSGTGTVAEGVVFSDGTVALRWRTAHRSTAVYNSLEDVEAIHGHGGATRILWSISDDPRVLGEMAGGAGQRPARNLDPRQLMDEITLQETDLYAGVGVSAPRALKLLRDVRELLSGISTYRG